MKPSNLKLKLFYLFLAGTLVLGSLLLIISSTINIEKFASWLGQPAKAQTTCHLFSSSSNVPSGFGAWWDVFTGKLLIEADCSSASATITIGDKNPHYIYEKGYVWRNNAWQVISFTGSDKVSGYPWYRNEASVTINLSSSELSNTNYIVAYVCTWRNNREWKCGCRDSSCSNKYWQLQSFKKEGAAPLPDTTPPTVSITSPTNGATVSGTITISANASDDLGIKEVEFFVGDIQAGTDSTAPYQVAFDTNQAANGEQKIEVIAIDTSDNETSDFVTVSVKNTAPSDTTPPSIPTNLKATTISSSQINLSWTASTDNIGVAGYKIYKKSQFVSSLNSLTYSDAGLSSATTYIYTVSAYDAAGNESAQSASVSTITKSIADTTPPTMSITSPTNNQTVSGVITISVNASDDKSVKEVTFYINSVKISSDDSVPYQASYNTKLLSNGEQQIKATAVDTSDNSASAYIAINVQNAETIALTDYWPMKAGNYWRFSDGASYTIEAKDTTRYPDANVFKAPWKNPDGSGEMTHVFNDTRGMGDYGAYYFNPSGNPTNGTGFDYSPPKKGAEQNISLPYTYELTHAQCVPHNGTCSGSNKIINNWTKQGPVSTPVRTFSDVILWEEYWVNQGWHWYIWLAKDVGIVKYKTDTNEGLLKSYQLK